MTGPSTSGLNYEGVIAPSNCGSDPLFGVGRGNLWLPRLTILTLVALAHLLLHQPSEPFYNNDESRHLMTGLFFRDLFVDRPFGNPQEYAVDYYLQYPALCLLIYPPFFHAVLGAAMLGFGTSLLVGKVTILVFALLACGYLHAMATRTHGVACASVATLIFGLSPLVFEQSQHVMLEVPTLACCLAAVFHWWRYLELERGRDLYSCAFALSMAVLTRPDGFFLFPALLLLSYGRGRLGLLVRKRILPAVVLAMLLIVPVYALIASQTKDLYQQAVMQGTYPGASRPLHPRNFVLYLAWLPNQMTWWALIPAGVGFWASLRARERCAAWPYLAMVLASYAMIVSIAEVLPRHAIYWSPALAVFAAHGLATMAGALSAPAFFTPTASLVVLGTFWGTAGIPRQFVRGYEDAAQFVVARSRDSRFCLFDDYYSGNFIYQIRRQDPDRRLWVLRGDKLFYSTMSDAHVNYKEYVRDSDGVLERIKQYEPEWIVVEDPQVDPGAPMAVVFRDTLREHPEQFRLVASIPLRSSIERLRTVKLLIYQNRKRTGRPAPALELEIQSLGRSLRATNPLEPSRTPSGSAHL